MRTRAALLALVAVAGLGLAGCGHPATTAPAVSATGDPIGSLEASVDAISRQVDADGRG